MRALSIVITVGIAILLAGPASAGDMRCGNDIVNINDSAFIVVQKCGEPISKVHVGYTINEEKKRELVIEELVYGPKNDYYYFVTTIGGRVAEIRSEHK
ncbi:MAG: DUF2845 domain-containing protein [Planctomycetaceae bacterium]|nr:MAG: DUF2845 domain-containing protein [Planctomycetaceae bacterium]